MAMFPSDYYLHVLRSPIEASHRRIMARVALNTLLDPDRYRVDLSEILALPDSERMRTRAFLTYCSMNQQEYVDRSSSSCAALIQIVEEK